MTITAHPKIYHIGTKETFGLFEGEDIHVQEKIDGSQFRFYKDDAGELHFFSRSTVLETPDQAGKLFKGAMEHILGHPFLVHPGLLYCGEAVCCPRANKVTYERVPVGSMVLWDVRNMEGQSIIKTHVDLDEYASRLGVESVALLAYGNVGPADLEGLMKRPSQLGGMLEGVVVKNRANGMVGKYVSQQFREIQKVRAPSTSDQSDWPSYVLSLTDAVSVPARWEKAIQRLGEQGKLTDSPQDIGPIIKEVQADIEVEAESWLKDKLYEKAIPRILKDSARNIALWYKERLYGNRGAVE